MNKDLFDTLTEAEKELNGNLDAESKRFLERSILERKLDGNSMLRYLRWPLLIKKMLSLISFLYVHKVYI